MEKIELNIPRLLLTELSSREYYSLCSVLEGLAHNTEHSPNSTGNPHRGCQCAWCLDLMKWDRRDEQGGSRHDTPSATETSHRLHWCHPSIHDRCRRHRRSHTMPRETTSATQQEYTIQYTQWPLCEIPWRFTALLPMAISVYKLCGLCVVTAVVYTMYCTNPAFGCQILINFLSCLVSGTHIMSVVTGCT